MRLDSLVHLARAVLAMTEVDRVIVFGSSSLLATHPQLGEQEGSPFLNTYDADLIPFPFEEELGIMLDEAFGEERMFHQKFGYHADIVRPKVAETFPRQWEERLNPLGNIKNVLCLDPHDMAATKCTIGREKDREQLGFLLSEGIIDPSVVRERMKEIELSEKLIARGSRFLDELTAQP